LELLSATVIGLWAGEISQPFGVEVQVPGKGVFKPPTSIALTPLLEMNSTAVDLVKPAGNDVGEVKFARAPVVAVRV
jgi:hypothetical protein